MQLPNLSLGRRTVEFSYVSGQVLEGEKWSETHVSGGGGYTDAQGRARVSPVSSRTTTHDDVWIKEHGSGRERAVRMVDFDVPVRAGHRVTFVSASYGRRVQNNVLYVNHDEGSWRKRRRDDAVLLYNQLIDPHGVVKGLLLLMAGGGGAIFGLLSEPGPLAWALVSAPVASVVVYVAVDYIRHKRQFRALDRHLAKLAKLILQQGGGPATTA